MGIPYASGGALFRGAIPAPDTPDYVDFFLVLKLFGVDLADDDGNVTEEDIMSMVNEGHEQGVLEADETEMITNIFELGDKEAADIMTHRTNMTVLDGSMSLKEAVDFILNEGVNTRYPVYGEDIDDIIGILHMRDAMTFAEKEENKDRMVMDIPGLLREANFIPETRNIDTLFKEMQSRKIHMEIVVDEYGQTAGLLTMEDILEEIVGNIMDEYDEEEDFIQAMEDGTFVMSGLTPLEDVMETLDIELPEGGQRHLRYPEWISGLTAGPHPSGRENPRWSSAAGSLKWSGPAIR